jgi:hypothetical protein
MEINSLRWSGNLFNRDTSRTTRFDKSVHQAPIEDQTTFHVPDDGSPATNFASITPRDLRELALSSYHAGNIDQDTYMTLVEELPRHAVDTQGQIIDLSDVTDDTGFDFQTYYRDQLSIALSLGDDYRAGVLKSVMAFIEP